MNGMVETNGRAVTLVGVTVDNGGMNVITEETEEANSVLFFFFQAEDGIRDADVTGVQTCALPIWIESQNPLHQIRVFMLEFRRGNTEAARVAIDQVGYDMIKDNAKALAHVAEAYVLLGRFSDARSEERRVGKEWRCRMGRGQGRER